MEKELHIRVYANEMYLVRAKGLMMKKASNPELGCCRFA
jgi:hypothetical protein